MGEIGDDIIDRMIENGYYPGHFATRSCRPPAPKKKKKIKEYPESTFNLGKFPIGAKHRKIKPEVPQEPEPVKEVPNFDTDGEAPF